MPINPATLNITAIEHQEHSFVIIGKFNTQIFSPAWLALEDLISKEESKNFEIQLSARGVSIFTCSWFRVEVTDDRFKISTTQSAYFEMLRDLTTGIFVHLSNTPVRSLGINLSTHLKCYDEKQLNALLEKVCPLAYWNGIASKPILEKLIVKQATVNGSQRLGIEKSLLIENGVFIDINDHFEKINGVAVWSDKNNQYVKASNLVELIDSDYDDSVSRSAETLSKIWTTK